jgi:arsenate reductase-like glutaredoxin family protein
MVTRSRGTEKTNTRKSVNKVVADVNQNKAAAHNINQVGESGPDTEYLLQRIESLENKLKTLEDTILKSYATPDLNEENRNINELLSLTANTDSVLAELWDNEKDAAYDRL